ncbi:MAG TPA: NAD(P)/FAD-dependent oxidoreductase [Myxococcota bacterium]|jgi:geranylgeranyl reductase family protein
MHVVIVGGGPAGSSAATFLARAGARVTVLEKSRFPRDKVCGDGLTPRSLWMLEELGLKALTSAIGKPVDRVYLASPGGRVLDTTIPKHIFGGTAAVVAREVLDHALIEHAVAAGAVLRESCVVESIARDASGVDVKLRGGEVVRADVILGCDGSPSVVRKELGAPAFPDEHSAFAVRVYYDNLTLSRPDAYALFWEKELLPAYGWIFPLPGGRANVGLGLRSDQMAKSKEKLPTLLDRFCELPRAKAELAGGRRVGRVKGHHLPFGSFTSPLVYDRAMLLGDAAGFINPLTGEGIEFALESGMLASAVVMAAASAGDFSARGLAEYERKCAARFRKAFKLNYRMQRFFERPALVDRVFKAAASSTTVLDQLADALLGEAPRLTPRLLVAVALGI